MMFSTFIINLKNRLERKNNVLKEFAGRDEFNVTVIEAIQHKVGSVGLWRTVRHILQNLVSAKDDFIILCEDDHQFTADYSQKLLIKNIEEAKKSNADILLGGVSDFQNAFKTAENLFWVEVFSGMQFTIIFRKIFSKILSSELDDNIPADFKIGTLTDKKFFIFPFISVQKGYAYSDVTPNNNKEGRVTYLFNKTIERIKLLQNVFNCQEDAKSYMQQFVSNAYNYISIPTYIINLPERIERRYHIENQFKGKKEFDAIVVDAVKHKIGALGLWMSFRKVIQLAIDNEDDVIIICEDDHEFTIDYSKDLLISNIIIGAQLGCDYIHGGTSKFAMAIPVTRNMFWTDYCLSTQFIIIYRSFFQTILDEPFDEATVTDLKLSEIATNKLLLYPYISIQKDFEYSDVTAIHNKQKDLVTKMFNSAKKRLEKVQKAYIEFRENKI